MTEKELITKLKGLKEITPSKEWAFSLKMQILGEQTVASAMVPVRENLVSRLLGGLFRREFAMAYAFSTLVFVAAGVFGFANYTLPGDREPQVAAIIESFKKSSKENNLVKAASDLAVAVKQNPSLAKEVALQVKENSTLLDIVGQDDADTKESSDVLYKTLDEQMIADLEKATLTEEQQKGLEEAKALFEEGEYAKALEKILLINHEAR